VAWLKNSSFCVSLLPFSLALIFRSGAHHSQRVALTFHKSAKQNEKRCRASQRHNNIFFLEFCSTSTSKGNEFITRHRLMKVRVSSFRELLMNHIVLFQKALKCSIKNQAYTCGDNLKNEVEHFLKISTHISTSVERMLYAHCLCKICTKK
jgi:hypothetical protein